MLVLTTRQLSVIDEAARERFIERMGRHLTAFAPDIGRLIGVAGMRGLASRGMDDAARFGFRQAGPVRLYLELICQFGVGFADDPLLPWAARALTDPHYPDEFDRATLLHEAQTAYIARVSGPGHARARAAFERLAARLERRPEEGLSPGAVCALLRADYPERAADAGPEALAELVALGGRAARLVALPQATGQAVASGFLFAVGHRAFEDPRHPWIARSVSADRGGAPDKREARLLSRARLYLSAALRNHPPS